MNIEQRIAEACEGWVKECMMDIVTIAKLRAVSQGDLSFMQLNLGLCGNFVMPRSFIAEACEGWELYSGQPTYPFSDGTGNTPKESYNKCAHNKMYEGEYGRRRMELAGRLADMFEKRINCQETT